jgi:hypothetical protein
MHSEIKLYNQKQSPEHQLVCDSLALIIDSELSDAESKIWHAHPVWFMDQNPIVGYSLQKAGIRLMFWSGADFDEPALNILGKKFKDASVFYQNINDIDAEQLKVWLQKSIDIQWDYKNIVRRKGQLLRLK